MVQKYNRYQEFHNNILLWRRPVLAGNSLANAHPLNVGKNYPMVSEGYLSKFPRARALDYTILELFEHLHRKK